MVITSQIGVRGRLESIHGTVPLDAVPASTRQYEVHAIASEAIGPQISDRSGGSLYWGQLLRATSVWESALIAVLFLLISGLVGLRIVDAVADRDIDLSSLSLGANAGGDAGESDRTRADDRAYEAYLSPETPPQLLSDEGRVVRLLIANRGRIRQHQIADETGWSKSKVSRICSRMHDDGTIEKRSVGRENVIALADRTPAEPSQSDEVENPVP